jgi:hypothetical protein
MEGPNGSMSAAAMVIKGQLIKRVRDELEEEQTKSRLGATDGVFVVQTSNSGDDGERDGETGFTCPRWA